MKLHRKILIGIVTLPILIAANAIEPSSSGAPASHTGAPGENTCGTAGCHDDQGMNDGQAQVEIQTPNGMTSYQAGQTYHLKVKIQRSGFHRFGFQLLALNANQNNCGTFILTDPQRTQIVQDYLQLTDRRYVTYTFYGTDETSNGVGEWEVKWKAPDNHQGPVTFFAATVSANDDMTDKNDFVYTSSKTIQ